MPGEWHWQMRTSATLPALAWVATIESGAVTVACGASVVVGEDWFFEGTWAGESEARSAATATTVFGSGIFARAADLVVVTPSHPLEGVYLTRHQGALVASNSLVALMVRAGLEPDPDAPYPTLFRNVADLKWLGHESDPARLVGAMLSIPMASGSIDAVYYENLLVRASTEFEIAPKPREDPFDSFADYSQRLTHAAATLIHNAPRYAPVVTLSSGYDSTAVAAVVAPLGAKRAVGFERSRVTRDGLIIDDSGAATAARLGMGYEAFDAHAYMARDDLPEADFLATGMSGEDVFMSTLEPRVHRTILMTGHWGGRTWDLGVGEHVKTPHPSDVSGCSLGEFRLRTDFIHVPLPFFGLAQAYHRRSFVYDDDMRPYSVGGHYDRPIARRLAEEAGLPRGSFARSKAAVGVLLQHEDRSSFAPATLEAVDRFAAAEGRKFVLARRTPTGRRQRGLIRLAHTLGMGRASRGLELRRQALTHFEPVAGALLFRWAVSVVRGRYEELTPVKPSNGRSRNGQTSHNICLNGQGSARH